METLQHISQTLALTMGVAWASGINLYATLLTLGILGTTGDIVLPPGLEVLTNPLVIGAAGLMYAVEFFADKMPGVDTGWDVIHTFIRIPAGAVLAAGSIGELTPAAALAAAIVGGGLAAGTHATKAGTRVLINTSPEPFTNWAASITEDVAVIAGMWAALHHPVLFLALLLLFIILMIWLIPRLWGAIGKLIATLRRWLGAAPAEPPPSLPHETLPLEPPKNS